jgi:sugar lactone lactonase YvrE
MRGLHELLRDSFPESRAAKVHWNTSIRSALAGVALLLSAINNHADLIYVWCEDGTIQRFSANGAGSLFATNDLSGWNGPVGLTLDNVGNLYAGFPGGSMIWKFLPDGSRSSTSTSPIDSTSGLAFDRAGNLYETAPNYSCVCRLTYYLGYGYVLAVPPGSNYTTANLSSPISPVFDGANNIYVANNTNANTSFIIWPTPYDNTIQRFTPDLTPLGAFATNLNNPWGLAFDASGNLYVSSSGDELVYRFTPGGYRTIFSYGISLLSNPRGLAFDSGGNLYVANAGNGTIVKITPSRTASVFASGLSGPTSIAIFPGLNVWSATGISLSNPQTTSNGAFQFTFTDNPGLAFTALGTTKAPLPLTNWTILGAVTEVSPGQYQFSDPQATNTGQRFYRIRSN